MTAAPPRKYNPGFLSDDELVASFCVRTHEFESMIEMLRECTGLSNQHQIVIGLRGSGKTSLLLRVAAEVRRDTDLAAAFFPIVFAEESYEVGTAGEFWLECLGRLASQAPERKDAPDLNATLADLRDIHDDHMLGERCLAALLDFADREDKRLVLMVENLNMMFRDMTDRDAGWRLRKVLQTEPRIVLFASATSRFDEIDHPDHALYDLFRVLKLRPLNTDECAVLWETVAGQSRPRETIRSLEILTGGSPRLLTIVARFGARLSFRELMDNLLDLVDDHTEYFKSHLESLPAQERRTYLALADLWEPALTKEIANRARLATSKCSAQLTRLVERGVVRLAGGTARRKQYYLSERMYNIYYLLRRGKDRLVEVLIRFMASYYSPDELREIGTRIAREAEGALPEMQPLYQSASAQLVAMSGRAHQREKAPAASAIRSGDNAQVKAARILFKRGEVLWRRNQTEDALATLNELLRRFSETETPEILVGVATSLVNKGVTLGALSRPEEELAAYDEALRRFKDSEAPELLEQVAKALVNKGVVLGRLDRREEALTTYDEVLRRFEGRGTPEFLEHVARALFNKGLTLGELNRWEEALAVHDEVLRRFSKVPELLEPVARSLGAKRHALCMLNELNNALVACDEILHRFNDSETPELLSHVASALFNKGVTLGELNRWEEALAAYDEVLRRFSDSDAPELLELVADALGNKGVALGVLNRPAEALATCEESLRRFKDSETPHGLQQMASALFSKGVTLGDLNRWEEALAAYDEVLRRFSDSDAPELLEHMASALCNKSVALGMLNRPDEALATCEEVLRRFKDSETPHGLQRTANALVNKGMALTQLKRPVETRDIEALLAILPKIDSLGGAIRALMRWSIDHGPERTCKWIQASPATELLWPLTTALEREMGLATRVPEEVAEVAEDIRQELAKMRQVG